MKCYYFKPIVFFLLVLLSASCSDNNGKEPLSSEKQISSYVIKADLNDLEVDFSGVIDQELQTITLSDQVLVGRPLIASYSAVGDVYLEDVLQESGETANVYSEGMIYKVVAEDKSYITYKILFEETIVPKELEDYRLDLIQGEEILTLEGTLDTESSLITLLVTNKKWIENIHSAVATFGTKETVLVGDVVQESGVTENDFTNPVVYTVITEANEKKEYTVRLVSPQTSGLPVIKVDTEGGQSIVDKTNYIHADFLLTSIDHPEFNLETETTIRGRGNTTWTYAKKPYRLKFDKKTSLFGLGKAKSWVLLANYLDPTFMNAHIAFEVGHRLEVPYTNHAFHVELFLNGQHRGNYVLTEQVQVNEFRVNIDEDEDMFLELDTYFDEDYKFYSDYLPLPVNIKSPEFTDESQMGFVREAVNELMAALFDDESGFPDNNYRELIDVHVLIDYMLGNEIVKNPELYHPKSTFMSKTRNGKFIMGPLWDFDWAYGYTGTRHYYFNTPDGLYFKPKNVEFNAIGEQFFCRFFDDPEFVTLYKKRWNEIYPLLTDLDQYVESYRGKLEISALLDSLLWPHDTADGFELQMNGMKNFLISRINYMHTAINEF